MSDGEVEESDMGTPQGGIISPVLANIYLHYSLDLWFERVFRKSCTGYARLLRYADDFVACFQQEADAISGKVPVTDTPYTGKHVEVAFKAEATEANVSVCKSVKGIHEEPCA